MSIVAFGFGIPPATGANIVKNVDIVLSGSTTTVALENRNHSVSLEAGHSISIESRAFDATLTDNPLIARSGSETSIVPRTRKTVT